MNNRYSNTAKWAVRRIGGCLGMIAVLLLSDPRPVLAQAPVFNDVPANYWARSFIETLAYNGVTGGCGNDNYCPESPVTRAQMAVFL